MKRAGIALVVAVLLPVTGTAGPRVTAQDIIDHFTARADGAQQRTRSVSSEVSGAKERSVFIGPAGYGSEAAPPETQTATQTASVNATPASPQAGSDQPASATTEPGPYDLLINFDLDSAALREDARQNLDAFVEALQSPQLAAGRFLIEGHTDATGPADYNLALSRRRAAAVVNYLVAHGVDGDRLTAQGFGETRPRFADPNDPENRRVETRILR